MNIISPNFAALLFFVLGMGYFCM